MCPTDLGDDVHRPTSRAEWVLRVGGLASATAARGLGGPADRALGRALVRTLQAACELPLRCLPRLIDAPTRAFVRDSESAWQAETVARALLRSKPLT